MQLVSTLLLLFALTEGVVALALASRLRSQRDSVLGEVLHAHPARRGARHLGLALQLGALSFAFLVDAQVGLFAALLLVPGAAAWWLAPASEDQRCGTRGVQYGWDTRPLSQLGDWRLTGDHLRFKIRGLWVAVALPRSQHEDMRARLEAACPGTESRFSD